MSNKLKITLITIASLALITITSVGIFWYVVLSDHQGPTFQQPQGTFIQEPTVTVQSNNIIKVTWATQQNYDQNEILLKRAGELYPNYGVGAQTQFDVISNTYVHTAIFQLTEDTSNDGMVKFIPGKYSFQVKSLTNGQSEILSKVTDLIY